MLEIGNVLIVILLTCIDASIEQLCPEGDTADFVEFEPELKSARLKNKIMGGAEGGTKIQDSKSYPWMASLHRLVSDLSVAYICESQNEPPESTWKSQCQENRQNKQQFFHTCGASLINHRYLLSAKHCFPDFMPQKCNRDRMYGVVATQTWVCRNDDIVNLVAILGTNTIKGFTFEEGYNFVKDGKSPGRDKGAWYKIEDIILRFGQDQEPGNLLVAAAQDSALVKLAEDVEFTENIKPILLSPNLGDVDLSKLVITGWGLYKPPTHTRRLDPPKTSDILRAGYVKQCTEEKYDDIMKLDNYYNTWKKDASYVAPLKYLWRKLTKSSEWLDFSDFNIMSVFGIKPSEVPLNQTIKDGYSDKVICVNVPEKDSTTTCPGDSGGPIFAKSKSSNKAVLLGVVSRGIKSCTTSVGMIQFLLGNLFDKLRFSYFMKTTDCDLYQWVMEHAKDESCSGNKVKCQQFKPKPKEGQHNTTSSHRRVNKTIEILGGKGHKKSGAESVIKIYTALMFSSLILIFYSI